MATPKGAPSPRRLNLTAELKADVRRRYEQTEESLSTMAADLGCCHETVRNIAKREKWVRYVPPPRGLSPAARLRIKAEALAAQQSPFIPAPAGIQEQDGNAGEPGPGSPLARGRADDPMPMQTTAPAPEAPPIEDTARAIEREVRMLLADVTAERERMKREGYAKHALREITGTIESLTRAHFKLQSSKGQAQPAGADNDYDDIPADIDEFRRRLARRIEAFIASRADPGDGGEPAAGGGAAA